MFRSDHVLRDRRLADFDTELQQLSVDAGRAPKWVGRRHLSDQISHFSGYSRLTWAPIAALPTPVVAEALAMPAYHGLGLNDEEEPSPVGPGAEKDVPERPVSPFQSRSGRIAL